ncbi:MAG: phosphoesterase [Thermoguttaceae bacterium]|nr:phosphoesterase [Thermoguttaceae bacterium]
MSEATTERVLVVPTELFHKLGYFQGFRGEVQDYLGTLFQPENVSYRPRGEVEIDPGFKQLIPYVIFRHTDADGRVTVFEYTRGTGQGEGRLHRKRSVGIGGHIAAGDTEGNGSPYEEGMRRELEEEVDIRTPYTARCVGLINDDETEVGRVHLGVVHLFDVERPDVHSREPEILGAGFRPVADLLSDLTGFETWSKICLEALFGNK